MATPVFNDWGNMSVLLLLLYYFAIKKRYDYFMYLCVVYSFIHLSIHSFKVLWDKENEDSITLTLWEGNFHQRGKIFT